MYSLRRVLAARFSLTMLVALSFIAFWAAVGVQRTLRQQTDRLLTGGLGIAEAILARGDRLPQQADWTGTGDAARMTRLIVVRDSGGAIIDANTPRAALLPLDTTAFARARASETAWVTQPWDDGSIRSIYVPAPAGSPPRSAVLQVASTTAPLADAIVDTLFILAGTVLLGAMATAFGAFWLARSAVRPVLEVVEQAATITAGVSHRRITTHADVSELASLVTVLNDLLDRSERAFSAQRRLVADVSHELKTPLAAMQGEFEVALRSERSPREYQLALRSGLEEVERLTALCDSLLFITRSQAGTLTPHLSPTDVGEVATRVLERARARLSEKDLTASIRLESGNGRLSLDQKLVERMLGNVLDNAIKFTPPGGQLSMGTDRTPGGLRIWIEDTGPGIPPDVLPHLFEPFYRVDQARTRGESTGLGLTVAASIAQLHHGAIRAENLPQGGARFEVELPVPPHG